MQGRHEARPAALGPGRSDRPSARRIASWSQVRERPGQRTTEAGLGEEQDQVYRPEAANLPRMARPSRGLAPRFRSLGTSASRSTGWSRSGPASSSSFRSGPSRSPGSIALPVLPRRARLPRREAGLRLGACFCFCPLLGSSTLLASLPLTFAATARVRVGWPHRLVRVAPLYCSVQLLPGCLDIERRVLGSEGGYLGPLHDRDSLRIGSLCSSVRAPSGAPSAVPAPSAASAA